MGISSVYLHPNFQVLWWDMSFSWPLHENVTIPMCGLVYIQIKAKKTKLSEYTFVTCTLSAFSFCLRSSFSLSVLDYYSTPVMALYM